MTESAPVLVGEAPLLTEAVVAVARHRAPVMLDERALARVADARAVIESVSYTHLTLPTILRV